MSEELHMHLKGCLVLVTTDGEEFHRTHIAEITPSGRYIRLESDAATPGGLQRWRALDSIQILEAFASPTGPSTMHGIVRLKNSAPLRRPHAPTSPLPDISGETSNIVMFPLPAARTSPASNPITARALSYP
ncbi:MAG: hypothetical protein QM760_13980 [Nibricoccus sp.]